MPFGWGIVSTGKHPDIKIAPAMAAAGGGNLVAVYSRDQDRAEAFAQTHDARAAYSQLGDLLKDPRVRSEEHTSELQSLRHLVCRLLLAKKQKEYSQAP